MQSYSSAKGLMDPYLMSFATLSPTLIALDSPFFLRRWMTNATKAMHASPIGTTIAATSLSFPPFGVGVVVCCAVLCCAVFVLCCVVLCLILA